jgi:hypothetical protein
MAEGVTIGIDYTDSVEEGYIFWVTIGEILLSISCGYSGGE